MRRTELSATIKLSVNRESQSVANLLLNKPSGSRLVSMSRTPAEGEKKVFFAKFPKT
jgi:hypothetical protein